MQIFRYDKVRLFKTKCYTHHHWAVNKQPKVLEIKYFQECFIQPYSYFCYHLWFIDFFQCWSKLTFHFSRRRLLFLLLCSFIGKWIKCEVTAYSQIVCLCFMLVYAINNNARFIGNMIETKAKKKRFLNTSMDQIDDELTCFLWVSYQVLSTYAYLICFTDKLTVLNVFF